MSDRTLLRMLSRSLWALVLATPVLANPALAQEFSASGITAIAPRAMPTAPGARAGAAFVTLGNRAQAADRLIAASTPVADSVQIHTMKMDGDVMRMREIAALEVGSGQTVSMGRASPEGVHLMLMGLKQPLKEGEHFPLTLQFERAGQLPVTVTVTREARGQPAHDAGESMHDHGH